MGSVRTRFLYSPHRSTGGPTSKEIGASPVLRPATAMRVGYRSDDPVRLRFLNEEPIEVAARRRSVQLPAGVVTWLRLEVKTDPRKTPAKAGDWMHIVEYPWSSRWFTHCPLRRPDRRTSRERELTLEPLARLGAIDLIEALEKSRYDHWERGSLLTAGTSEVGRLFSITYEAAPRRNYQSNTHLEPLELFGVSRLSFSDLQDALIKEKQIQELTRALEAGTLRFKPSKARFIPRIHNDIRERSNEILTLSINQAMGGPRKMSDVHPWEGRPVGDLVEYIFKQHVDREYERYQQQFGKYAPPR